MPVFAEPRTATAHGAPHRRGLAVVVLLLAAGLAFAPWGSPVTGQSSELPGVPRADCGPGSDPETAEQGRVPAADYDSGRADSPYTCNTELVGHHGATGGFKVHRYVDAQGQECAYYDSTLIFGLDLLVQSSTGVGVLVLDMTDPSEPVLTDQLMTPAMLSPHESLELNQARGLLAAVTGTAATYPGIVDVYDVSQDCTQPELKASAPVGFFGHESGFAPDGMTFYTASTALSSVVAVDLTDPSTPTPVAFLPVNSHGIQISDDGTRAYMTPLDIGSGPIPSTGELDGGIAIYDISAIQDREPLARAELLSELSWPHSSIAQTAIPVVIDGDPYLVEIDEFVDFTEFLSPLDFAPGVGRIIDISDETAPEVVADIRLEVHDPALRPSFADDPGATRPYQGYAGHYCAVPQRDEPEIVACSMIGSGLRVFDIRDPRAPKEIAYFNAPANPSSLILNFDGAPFAMSAPAFVPERGEIWYSDTASGFWAVRLTNDVWPFDAQVDRLAGPSRIETAVEASRDTFTDGEADAVVLARSDVFADAITGGPLAVSLDAPILLSSPDALHPAAAAEVQRVLGEGGTVHLLGGTAALSTAVEAQVRALGVTVQRHAGSDRFGTAVAVAEAIGDADEVVLADGGTYADAVVAAPLAADRGAVMLLTDGGSVPAATQGWLDGHPDVSVTAIGAAAASAAPEAEEVIDGSLSGDLSADVATLGFDGPARVGIARADDFADALSAGAVLGRRAAGPVLLVGRDTLPGPVADVLTANATSIRRAIVLGGESAVSSTVLDAVARALA